MGQRATDRRLPDQHGLPLAQARPPPAGTALRSHRRRNRRRNRRRHRRRRRCRSSRRPPPPPPPPPHTHRHTRTFGDAHTSARPVGSDSAFWLPVTATSTPQSSNWNSSAPMELTPSTSSSAGWLAASIAPRTPLMSLVTPVVVSLCTTATALIFLSVSLASTSCRAAAAGAAQQRAVARRVQRHAGAAAAARPPGCAADRACCGTAARLAAPSAAAPLAAARQHNTLLPRAGPGARAVMPLPPAPASPCPCLPLPLPPPPCPPPTCSMPSCAPSPQGRSMTVTSRPMRCIMSIHRWLNWP
jgi:hypothetical protein